MSCELRLKDGHHPPLQQKVLVPGTTQMRLKVSNKIAKESVLLERRTVAHNRKRALQQGARSEDLLTRESKKQKTAIDARFKNLKARGLAAAKLQAKKQQQLVQQKPQLKRTEVLSTLTDRKAV